MPTEILCFVVKGSLETQNNELLRRCLNQGANMDADQHIIIYSYNIMQLLHSRAPPVMD